MKLQNFKFFIELGNSVQMFNEMGKSVTDHRELLRVQKEKKREMFT